MNRPMKWNAWNALPLILLVCILAYGNIFTQQFVYDDRELVTENPAIRQLSQLPQVFASHYWSGSRPAWAGNLYRPLVGASLALDYAVGGLNARVYKVTNFSLHLLCSWLVFLLGRRIACSPQVSLAAALLFAVHPLHTEAVTSIVGRTELLSTLFGLLAIYTWLGIPGSYKEPYSPGGSGEAYWLALLCLLLALLSKESAVLLPVLFLIADAWRFHAEGQGTYVSALKRALSGGLKCRYWGVAGLLIFYGSLRWKVLGFIGLGGADMIPKMDNPLAHADALNRALTALALFWKYLWQHVWPFGLSADYSFNQIPIVASLMSAEVLAGLLLGLVFLAAGLGFRTGLGRYTLPLWIWVFPLLAASNLLTPVITIYAERLTYLPSAGFALASVMGASAVVQRISSPILRRMVGPAFAAVLLVLSYSAYQRNKVWADEGTFLEAMVRDAPRSARAHHNWGNHLLEIGRVDEAEKEFQAALKIMPELAASHVNLGLIEEGRNNLDAALTEYQRAIQLDPKEAEAYNNMGKVLREKGLRQEALDVYVSALKLAPHHYRARFNLANSLAAMGRFEEAVEQYRQTIAINPAHAPSYFNLGNTLIRLGRNREARQAYEVFVRVWKGDPAQAEQARLAIRRLEP